MMTFHIPPLSKLKKLSEIEKEIILLGALSQGEVLGLKLYFKFGMREYNESHFKTIYPSWTLIPEPFRLDVRNALSSIERGSYKFYPENIEKMKYLLNL